MKRCYERENWLFQFGWFEIYNCGAGVTLEDGQRYCLLDGRLLDYVGYCGNSRPVTIESEQMTFGDFKLD